MLNWMSILIVQEHCADLLREAENERLVRLARAGQERRAFYSRVMVWLGQQLITWGIHLQERFGATVSSPALQVARLPR